MRSQVDLRLVQIGQGLLILGLRGQCRALKGLLFFDRDRQGGQLLAALGLPLGVLRIDLGLLHGRLGEADGDLVVGRVDHHQQIALVHELVVGDRQLDDLPGDFAAPS